MNRVTRMINVWEFQDGTVDTLVSYFPDHTLDRRATGMTLEEALKWVEENATPEAEAVDTA